MRFWKKANVENRRTAVRPVRWIVVLGIELHPAVLDKLVDCIHAVFELARGNRRHDL